MVASGVNPRGMNLRALWFVLVGSAAMASSFGQTAPSIETDPAYRQLDFWVGDWEVRDATKHELAGTDRVEKVLKGAAIVEHWRDTAGHEGKSWFYFSRPEHRWKQVWVTEVGFIKEKALIETFADGGVRFRGEVQRANGGKILDQTTLTPLADGSVHQLIEISADAGKMWQTTFDAIYTRRATQ